MNISRDIPKEVICKLKWKYPFYKIPQKDKYQPIEIIGKNSFYCRADINGDGIEEHILVQYSFYDKIGSLFIIGESGENYGIIKKRWKSPANSLYWDYGISIVPPGEFEKSNIDLLEKERKLTTKLPSIITNGYIGRRIIYFENGNYLEEKIY